MAQPNPQHQEALKDEFLQRYNRRIQFEENEQALFDELFAEQQSIIDAQKSLTEEATINRNIREGNLEEVPPEIRNVLDIQAPGETFKPFSEFMPGLGEGQEVIPAGSQRALPPAIQSLRGLRNVYDPKRIPDMEAKAIQTATDYYIQQGLPSYAEAQREAIDNFVGQYGTLENFVNTDPLGLGGTENERANRYNVMLGFVQNPPSGFSNTAEQKAYEDLKGDPSDPSIMGTLKRPQQPRRYRQYGDMPKVGPRVDTFNMPDAPTTTGISPNIGFMQGASPLAEDLRQQPELAREMSVSELATEAFRPQIVKSGEQVRQEKSAQEIKRNQLLEAQAAIMNAEKGVTEEQAFNQLVDEMMAQAKTQADQQMRNRVTPKMLLDYHTGSLTAMGRLGMMPSQEEIYDDMLTTIAQNAVLTEYRNAGLYEYATKYDKLKGGRTYGSRGMNALADAFTYMTEDEYGSNYIQQLKKTGRIDPDAITEATPMQYARNLNFVFRIVLNPAMDVLGEGIDMSQDITDWALDTNYNDEKAMRTGSAEARFAERYGQGLTSPTIDLTDEVDLDIMSPIDSSTTLLDAYIKELLVETATGRTLGNDIVSFHPDEYYEMMQEDAVNPDQIPFFGDPDTFVVGGTLFEVMLPLEAPIIGMQKAVSGASKLPRNWRIYSSLPKEMKAAQIADAAPPTLASKLNVFEDSSKISSHIADDAADVVLAAERVEDLGTLHKGNPEAVEVMKMGLGKRGQSVVDEMMTQPKPSEYAAKKIDELADAGMERKTPALHQAAKESASRRAAYGKDAPGTSRGTRAAKRKSSMARKLKASREGDALRPLDPVAETLAHDAMKGKVATELEGFFGLDDYHLLTDRVAVSSNFLRQTFGTGDDAKPVMLQMVDDVETQLGRLQPESIGPRVIPDEYFRPGVGPNPGRPIELANADGTKTALIAGGRDGQAPVNYNRLFQADRGKDPYLDEIIRQVKDGQPITYAQDVYLRNRALEKMAEGYSMRMTSEALQGAPGVRTPSGSSGIFKQDFVRPVEEGTEFARRVSVPDERRLGIARTVEEGIIAYTPRSIRNFMSDIKEGLMNPIRTLDDLGQPLDPRVSRVQEASTEALVSLQRQTPIVARMLNKQYGGDHTKVVDTMFGEALNGKDYTALIKQDINPVGTGATYSPGVGMSIEELATDPKVTTFYEQLLGPSFGLPENQLAFRRALLQFDVEDDIFDNATIAKILTMMKEESPGALATAAIRTKQPKFGAQVTAEMVDVTGAKLAWATDATRQIRVQKVITEVMPEGNINLAYYTDELKNYRIGFDAQGQPITKDVSIPGMSTQEVIEAVTAERILGVKDPRITKEARNIVSRPAQQFTNYIKGVRTQAKDLGYSDAFIMSLIDEQPKLYVGNDPNMAVFSDPKADRLADIIYGDLDKKGIVKNLTRLRRASPTLPQYLGQIYEYNIALRKRLVSGQLGGLLLPNPIYHAENFVTAPMIASITAPEYVGTVMAQQGRSIARTPYVFKGAMPTVSEDVLMGGAGLERYVTGVTDQGTPLIGRLTVEEAIDAYRTKNLGSTQQSLHLDDNFIRDVQTMAGEFGIKEEILKGTLTPGQGTSFGMRFADSTDRMFREAVFFKALGEGRTPEQAAQLAREVLLDYGAMPGITREWLGNTFLYMSFTYMMGKEVTMSLLDPKKYRLLVSQLNYHRKVSEDMFGRQTELTDHMAVFRQPGMYDDESSYNVYYRNPIIGSFGQVSSMVDSARQAQISNALMKEAAKMPQKAGLDGLLDIGYSPFLDLLRTVEMEYKTPLPEKAVYQINALPTSGPLSGPVAKRMFDLEYVAVDKRVPGKAEMGVDRYIVDPNTGQRKKLSVDELEKYGRGGYQLRFKSTEGYAKFVAFQQTLQFAGYGRLMNDLTGAAIAAGLLPEGTTFGYSEKGNPVLYLFGRQKTIRVPKEWEKLDRQVRQYERDLIEFMEGYE